MSQLKTSATSFLGLKGDGWVMRGLDESVKIRFLGKTWLGTKKIGWRLPAKLLVFKIKAKLIEVDVLNHEFTALMVIEKLDYLGNECISRKVRG